MLEQNTHLFRKQSLERLQSPEKLDQAIQLVKPKDWLPLGMMTLLLGAGAAWSLLGKMPMTVNGQGILLDPHQVVPLQSPISGQLESLPITAGQCVTKGELLATINPTGLNQQLEQQQKKHTQLQQQFYQAELVRTQRTGLARAEMATQRLGLTQQLSNVESLTPVLNHQGILALEQQRANLQQQLQDTQELTPVLEQRLQSRQALAKAGAVAPDMVLQAEQDHRQNLHRLGDLRAQLQQLDLQMVEARQQHLDNLNQISQVQANLQALETQEKQLEQDNLTVVQQYEQEIQAGEQQIAQLQRQVTENSEIRSPQAGCIVETTATAGQVVTPGMALGRLQAMDPDQTLPDTGVIYFAVAQGKRIQPGMEIMVTPDTVKRERFGSIRGVVTAVSPLPVSREGAVATVGNPEMVDTLMASGSGHLAVTVELETDGETSSGYGWSSSLGPEESLTLGTTLTARVTVEERAPITFLMPILREWVGG
ncbi:NHLP bacteriocin system secretion protein [Leptothoe spongobia]|uniref:NHLP bacteriocin system secretion protein n=1 Tax=Leptothoe spongobia TAU-MAC 1115 TaxID=1967444 RepID=A0A947DG79_9CYAN|nr:NHLP bacteriocin system secretion protein [Leptothoe spongobia]MBT9315824.1 NHLP bacteriocin system secretion protein [Leptothoe spongobia TAU-MAC 1115]